MSKHFTIEKAKQTRYKPVWRVLDQRGITIAYIGRTGFNLFRREALSPSEVQELADLTKEYFEKELL